MIPYLDLEHASKTLSVQPKRIAKVHVYILKAFHEIVVDINGRSVISDGILQGRHSRVDSAYMKQVEAACLADPRIRAKIQELKLPGSATVIVEPWTYATDGMSDMSERI